MKIKNRNKGERLEIVLDLINKLKNFPTVKGTTIDLYIDTFPAIVELKEIFSRFVNQDDSNSKFLVSESGTIHFPEISRKIEYILPIKKINSPVFVLKHTHN